MTYWRLPKGVDDVLPPRAWQLEQLRRRVLDVFDRWGYDYLEPPVIEYLDALLVGSGEDLDLQTLKVVDQDSGRQLGVRADMTSQAVRVDAHSLRSDNVQRYCYAGPVVFAKPHGNQASRVPLKAGAEMFGASGVAADAEVIGLMLEGLKVANMHTPVLLLGHMGIYLGLVEQLLAEARLGELFNCIQRKGASDIRALLDDSSTAAMLSALPDLMGDSGVLELAGKVLNSAAESVRSALDELKDLAAMIKARYPQVDLRIDVSELSGYGYHNGPVFAVYHPQHGRALAQGGRYDGVGDIFGRGRAATGFDLNLKQLMDSSYQRQGAYFAPYTADAPFAELTGLVSRLRGEGHRVIVAAAEDEQPPHDCIGMLVHGQDGWLVQPGNTAPNE